MTIELFTLCDGAFNYNGKLTIVGTLSTLTPSVIPTRVKMGIAMRIRVEQDEVGEKDMRIRFKTPDGGNLPVDMQAKIHLEPTNEPFSYIVFAADIQGFPLDKEGVFCANVEIEGNNVANYPFYVKKREE